MFDLISLAMFQTVIAPHVRLDMASDHPAAALIAAVVIGALATPLRRYRRCA